MISVNPSFEPAVPVHAYERIVEQIERAIISGEIPVGTKLPSERELMQQFDVSRPTIREALRILQSMGLLEPRPGTRGGPVVLAPGPDTLERSFRTMLGTDTLELAHLLEYRVMLESASCRLAALRHTPEQLAQMRLLVAQMAEQAANNNPDFANTDLRFHQTIWEASGNRILQVSGEAVSGVLRLLMQQDAEGPQHDNSVKLESSRIDASLVDAIAARDAETASRIARRAVAARFAPLLKTQADRDALASLAK